MIRRILAYLLFGLGFLTITFFKNYTGSILPYPFLFYILGFLMLVGGYFFLRFTPTHKEIKTREKLDKLISDLLEHGERVKVDLLSCEIKEHNYSEERNRYGNENELLTLDIERNIQAWDAIEYAAGPVSRISHLHPCRGDIKMVCAIRDEYGCGCAINPVVDRPILAVDGKDGADAIQRVSKT